MSPLVMIYSPYFVYCTMANMVDGNSMHTFHTINEPSQFLKIYHSQAYQQVELVQAILIAIAFFKKTNKGLKTYCKHLLREARE